MLKTNVLQCAFNYCIQIESGTGQKSCEVLDASSYRFGRDKDTHSCITAANTPPSSGQVDICASGYCIYKDPISLLMDCR